MKKMIIFLKNLRDKFYIKLIEILVESESRKMPINYDYRNLLAFCRNNNDI